MKSINPLHIGALFIVLILFFSFKVMHSKEELREAKKNYSQAKNLAEELSGLQGLYGDKERMQRRAKRILNSSKLKKSVTYHTDKDSMQITAKELDLAGVNYLFSKILNDSFVLSRFKVKPLDANKVAVEMEIKW